MAMLIVGPGGWKVRASRVLLLGMATVLTLAPWAWRNARVLGEPVWTTTHGGYTLALANNPVYYSDVLEGPPGTVWSGLHQAEWFAEVKQVTFGMTEPQADRTLRSAGSLRMLVERPEQFARAGSLGSGGSGVWPRRSRLSGMAEGLDGGLDGTALVGEFVGTDDPLSWQWPRVSAIGFVVAVFRSFISCTGPTSG